MTGEIEIDVTTYPEEFSFEPTTVRARILRSKYPRFSRAAMRAYVQFHTAIEARAEGDLDTAEKAASDGMRWLVNAKVQLELKA